MTLSPPVLSPPVSIHFDEDLGLGVWLLLREHEARGHAHVVRRGFDAVDVFDVLPPGSVVLRSGELAVGTFVLAEHGDALVLVRANRFGSNVVTTAADLGIATRAMDDVAARVPPPPPEDGRLLVHFTDDRGVHKRRIDVRPWSQIASLYPARVRTALDTVVAHRPDEHESRRLLVWYGAPGTGKTTAVRALLYDWREWADAYVVSDPEILLTDSRYLRRIVTSWYDDDDERWRVFVLEDAEALLHTTVQATSALGKLLNLADGMLGQGLRCMFLLTTNEPVAGLHPALVRPGRCLARIEFAPLSAAETAAVLGRPVDRGQTLAEVMATRAVATQAPAHAVGQYL